EAARAGALCTLLDLVDLLPRKRRAPRHADATHPAALRNRAPRNREFRLAKDVARVEDLELVAQIGAIGSVALHRLRVRHAPERGRHLVTNLFPERTDQTLGERDDVILADERSLDVDLREFRLAIDPQVLVAKASSDLEVAIEPSHHQELLVELRRLR